MKKIFLAALVAFGAVSFGFGDCQSDCQVKYKGAYMDIVYCMATCMENEPDEHTPKPSSPGSSQSPVLDDDLDEGEFTKGFLQKNDGTAITTN